MSEAPYTFRLPLRACLSAALLLGGSACGGSPEYVAPPPPAVTVEKPVQRKVTEYLEMTGTIEAVETVEIRARVEGFLDDVHFEEGTVVEKGSPLFTIDPAEYRATVERTSAAVQVAKASVDLANATLRLREQARKTGAVSELEVMENRAERDVAAAQLEAARADDRRARLDLGYTEILAPVTGRVGRREVDPGNLVGAGEKTLLTTIVRYDPIYAYFSISERAVLTLGDRAAADNTSPDRVGRALGSVELGRANDEGYPFRGTLHYVDQGIDPDTGTLLLRAVFPNPQPVRLLPGLFARGRVPIGEREGALLVSERALGSDQGGKYLLVVDADDVAHHRAVQVGFTVEGLRVIDKGIEPGDRIITNGILRARPGAKVSPQAPGTSAVGAGPPDPHPSTADPQAEPGGS